MIGGVILKFFCLLILWMTLISVILMGCQSNSGVSNIDAGISKVSISNPKDFGKVNSDFFVIYEDVETLEIFQNAILKAVKQEGVVNISEPEFDLKVIYKDGNEQEYHLWVGEKGQKSTLMNIDDTHTIYSISEELTNQLIDLVK